MANLRGLSYRVELDGKGNLLLSEDIALLREAIYSVLETRQLERVMRPEYGTPDFIFSSVPYISVLTERIRQILTEQIPEVDRFEVSGTIDDAGISHIEINWYLNDEPQSPIGYQLTS